MLTFLLLFIALIAFTHYIFYWIYRLSTWIIVVVYNFLSFTVTLALDKASKPKPPKPPLPPKPVGYSIPARPTAAASVAQENHVPSIVVSNSGEHARTLPRDDNNNTSPTRAQTGGFGSSEHPVLNGETTPKTIAPSEITSRTTTKAVELQLKGDPTKAAMAREESFESVENEVCCTNLASYFVHKAKVLAHPHPKKKVPPPKPPKPKKEDIERARKRLSSFGEEIPGGREGFRYADDESTESSLDYKDVIFENGKILAINRFPKPPKSDSPELEAVTRECDYEPLEFYHQNTESCEDVFLDAASEQFESGAADINTSSNKSIHDDLNKTDDENVASGKNNLVVDVKGSESGNLEEKIKSKENVVASKVMEISESIESKPHFEQFEEKFEDKQLEDKSKDLSIAIDEFINAPEFKKVKEEPESVQPVVTHDINLNEVITRSTIAPENLANEQTNIDLNANLQVKKSSHNYDYAVPTTKKKLPLDERHSWPARKKNKKVPPERPPPPRRKCMSLSDDDQQTDKVKPPRPPPPTPPIPLKSTKGKIVDPNPPPRRNRSRSRTLEITPTSLKDVIEPTSNVRRAASFTGHSQKNVEVKPMYSTIDATKKHDKMKFRPLPPPPAPPRTHSKKQERPHVVSDDANPKEDMAPLGKNLPDSVISLPDNANRETGKTSKSKPARPSKPDLKAPQSSLDSQIHNSAVTVDENANITPSSQPSFLRDKKGITRSSSEREEAADKPRRYASSTFYCDNLSSSGAASKNRSKSPSPMLMRVRSSFSHPADGTESEVSGINADIDSSVNSSRRTSVERASSKSKKSDRSSVFYYDIPPEIKLCMEKSVQTSPDISSCQATDKGEDSDELMDIANDIRRELNSILERRRNVESTDSEVISSQDELPIRTSLRGRPGSSRSSEVSWQESSDESEVDELDGGPAVRSPEEKKKDKLRFIATELMTSEATFVDALRLLNVDFQDAVHKASAERGSPIVPDEVMNHIFHYLPPLQNLNENLLQEIKHRIDNWDNLRKISDVIVKVGPFLKLYSSYIRDFESITVMLDEACRKYSHFAQVVKDFEASPTCQKLALKHFLLKPVQRIPQYRLLLEDYLHNLTPDSTDYEDTMKALQIVSEVANHANETMKQGDNFLKLVSIQNSLLTHHEVVKPGRVFLKEGELMKLSRRVMQSRWFILFNDSLLYLTPVQQGLYRINHELPLTGMRVSVPMQTEYRNEFSVISVTRSFSLAAKSAEERDEWITDLTRAIEENAVKRSSFINTQIQQQSKTVFHMPDTALGKQAPVWIPDSRVTMCQLCTTEFTITFRRHHCRACGRVVCRACSINKARLHYLDNQLARVCDACHTKLNEGSADSKTSSTDQPTTDSETEFVRSGATGLRASNQKLAMTKRNNLPSVLKERSKREARLSPTHFRVRANDQGSDISGHLFMLNGKAWKRFWFVLKDKVLYTYKASEDIAAKKSLPLLGYTVEISNKVHQGIDPSLIFMLRHPGQPNVVFHAESVGFAERWVKAMRCATVL